MPRVERVRAMQSATQRDRQATPEDQVFLAYISIVSTLDFAQASTIEYTDDGICIWTVIDADPEDRQARERIYEAELVASDAAPDATVNFRLVNKREHTAEALKRILPAGTSVTWHQPAQA